MSDLIDRQAITEHIRNKIDMQDLYLPIHIIQLIDELPTIDAVPVVRCKDCKYWNPKHAYCEGVGNWFGMVDEWSENGFCYKGERRTDAEIH